jgi:hypothetical protein
LISGFDYGLETPQTGDENVRLNLWLFDGAAPTDNQEIEIIIKSFNFLPLSSAQPAYLNNFGRSVSGQNHFDLQGQADWRYEISASSNLLDWEGLSVLLATNNVLTFTETNLAPSGSRFFRAETLQ